MLPKLLLPCLPVAFLAFASCNDKPPLPERTLELKVYPNPTFGPVHVAVMMDGQHSKTLLIYDPEGKKITEETLVPQFTGPASYEHDLTGKLPGYYTFVLKSEKPTLTTKVLKQ